MDNLVIVFDQTSQHDIFPSLATMSIAGKDKIVLRRRPEFELDLHLATPRRCVIIINEDSSTSWWSDGSESRVHVPHSSSSFWHTGNLLVGARGYNKVPAGGAIRRFYGNPFEGGNTRICYVSGFLIQPRMRPLRMYGSREQVPLFDLQNIKMATVTHIRAMGKCREVLRYILHPVSGVVPSHPYEPNQMFADVTIRQ